MKKCLTSFLVVQVRNHSANHVLQPQMYYMSWCPGKFFLPFWADCLIFLRLTVKIFYTCSYFGARDVFAELYCFERVVTGWGIRLNFC